MQTKTRNNLIKRRNMRKFSYLGLFLLTVAVVACNPQNQQQKKAEGINPLDLDTTVSAGADFDTYANGGWKKNNPIPDEKSRYGSFNKLIDQAEEQIQVLFTELQDGQFKAGSIEEKISNFYKSGMDTVAIETAGLEPIQEYLAQVDQLKTKSELQQLVAQWHRLQINPLFYIYSDADQKNSTMEVAYVNQGGLRMPNRDYYLNTDDNSVEIQEKYRQYITDVFQQLGASEKEASQTAKTIYQLEKEMATVSMSMLDQRDPYKVYNKMTTAQLQKISPNFDWKAYFNETGINDPGEFIVCQPEFFKGISRLLQNESLDTWKLYLKWQLVSRLSSYLPKTYVDLSFDFYGKVLSGSLVQRPRWKQVQEVTNGALSEAVGQLYVERYFPPEAKERMVKLVENLRTSLQQRIEKLTWMGDTTKQKAIEKLQAITVKVGYPDKWKDYSKLEVTADSYVSNALNSGKFDFDRMVGKINKPVDKTEWMMPPQMVNAYYNPTANEIVFPAAILQPPFFYMNADDATNYGAIGVVIGHEMTHGFDDQGRQYDKEGNLNDWWTAQDAERFNAATKVLADQFDQFTVLDSVKADGKLTLGENIADLGGLKVAFNALEMKLQGNEKEIDGFTPEQRFFLAYAHLWAQNVRDEEKLRLTKVDVHSLGRYRILGPLKNMPEFYQAFQVTANDDMFLPENERVVIW